MESQTLCHGTQGTRQADKEEDCEIVETQAEGLAVVRNLVVHYEKDTWNGAKNAIVVRTDSIMDVFHHSQETVVNCIEETAHKDEDRTQSILCLFLGGLAIGLDQNCDTHNANR